MGAIVRGVDLAEVDDAGFTRIEAAWHEYAVLVFPDQHLSDAAHIAFSERFGPLERALTRRGIGPDPALIVLTNLREDGTLDPPNDKRVRFNSGNLIWHTDSSFKRVPAKASLLRACQIPGTGGETEFADMRSAYDELDEEMKARLEGKIAEHSYVFSQSQVGGLDMLSPEELDKLPPVCHPVVRTHPATGRRNLYIGRHASHIVGEDVERSRALLRRLDEQACNAPRIFHHRWQVGDVVIWDNRCVLHHGLPSPVDEARVMVRTTVAGDAAGNEWVMGSAGGSTRAGGTTS